MKTLQHALLAMGLLAIFGGSPSRAADAAGFLQRWLVLEPIKVAGPVWWFNGQEVIGIYNDRQTVIDDGVSKRLTLKKGPNVIRAAIVNAGGATDFCARFLDGDDQPVKGIVVSLR